jgi:hypothetical protein
MNDDHYKQKSRFNPNIQPKDPLEIEAVYEKPHGSPSTKNSIRRGGLSF